MFLLITNLQYLPEGSGSWKYNHYFSVADGAGKMFDYFGASF